MEIFYCDRCGIRIGAEELSEGRAVSTGKCNYCAACVKAKPELGAGARAGTRADAGAREARKIRPEERRTRSTQRRGQTAARASKAPGGSSRPERTETGRGTATPVVFFAAFGGALALAAVAALLVLGGRGKTPKDDRPIPADSRRARGRPGARAGHTAGRLADVGKGPGPSPRDTAASPPLVNRDVPGGASRGAPRQDASDAPDEESAAPARADAGGPDSPAGPGETPAPAAREDDPPPATPGGGRPAGSRSGMTSSPSSGSSRRNGRRNR